MGTSLMRVLAGPWRRMNALLIERKKASLDLEVERKRSLRWLDEHYEVDPREIYKEYTTSAFREWFLRQRARLPDSSQTSSAFDCESLYLITRVTRPHVVVETGVLYGAFSGHILAALERNGDGHLVSIDLPNEANSPGRDYLVRSPREARRRWEIVEGDARDKLESVCKNVGSVDLFNHDSDHRYGHQRWELETAARYMSESGVLTSHDVLASPLQRSAFRDFCDGSSRRCARFRNLGVAIP